MKKTFTISEIAQLLNISAPTLRFWEEKGLFRVSKSANTYRQYTVQDLIHIADIIFYRHLGLPIGKLKHLDTIDLEQYGETLESSRIKLESQMGIYRKMYHSILLKKSALQTVVKLNGMTNDFCYAEIPFDRVVKFDYYEKEKVLQYTKNTSLYVRYFDTEHMDNEIRGIVVDTPKVIDQILWEKHSFVTYASFLIKEKVDQNYSSDVLQKLSCVKKVHRTGSLLARYLLTATENGEKMDYLEAFVEILD